MATLPLGCRSSHKDTRTTADEATAAYNGFFQSLKDKRNAGTEEIISLTKEWRKLAAAVSVSSERDGTEGYDAHADGNRIALGDSVALQMARLINGKERSFADYLSVVQSLNDVVVDTASQKLVASVHLFYRNASAIPTYKGSGKDVVNRYDNLLKDALTGGIRTRQQAIGFLRHEDVAFRSFLLHLPTLISGKIPLDSITVNTAKAVTRIIALADTAHNVFDRSEVVILLAMRNNRRLLQNAEACVDCLPRFRLTDDGQAAACLWMILQPWISFDSFAYALMDEEQLCTMEKLAEQMPPILAKLKGIDFPLEMEGLPTLLMETFILGYK